MDTKNLEPKEGYLNRHIEPLPKEKALISIFMEDYGGELFCVWTPFRVEDYYGQNYPADGYLGTAKVILGKFNVMGFDAWEQNNWEFIHYKILAIEIP